MNPDIIINVILTIFLGQTLDSGIWMLLSALTLAGLFGLFRKSGLKGWEALIPCLREAKLGEIAGREKEGRVAAVAQGLGTLLNLATLFVPADTVRGDRAIIPRRDWLKPTARPIRCSRSRRSPSESRDSEPERRTPSFIPGRIRASVWPGSI